MRFQKERTVWGEALGWLETDGMEKASEVGLWWERTPERDQGDDDVGGWYGDRGTQGQFAGCGVKNHRKEQEPIQRTS